MTEVSNNGPLMKVSGLNPGRSRNTLANLFSKYQVGGQSSSGGAAALPALSPEQTAGFYAQLAGLEAQYRNQVAALRAQRVGIRAGFKAERAGIKAEAISGIEGAVGAALTEGTVGSSFDLERRIGVRAQQAGALAGARNEMLQALAQNRLGVQEAALGQFMGAQQLQQQALALQQQALAQQLQQNLIISGQESTQDILRALYKAQLGALRPGQPGTTSALVPPAVAHANQLL